MPAQPQRLFFTPSETAGTYGWRQCPDCEVRNRFFSTMPASFGFEALVLALLTPRE